MDEVFFYQHFNLIGVIIYILLVIQGGVFSLASKAFTMTNISKIKEGSKGSLYGSSAVLLEIYEKMNKFNTCRRLINVIFMFLWGVHIGTGIFLLDKGFVFIFIGLVLVLFYLMVSEILPSGIASNDPLKYAFSLARVIKLYMIILTPVIAALNGASGFLLRLFGKSQNPENGKSSEEEVISMVEKSYEEGHIDAKGKQMISSIFDYDDIICKEIMTARTDVFLIDIEDYKKEDVDTLLELKFSRIPVCKGGIDNIEGILFVKDFLLETTKGIAPSDVDIAKLLREPYMVPETKKIDSLFVELQKKKQHMAILIDEYGGFSGIVTMEDIIEQIMGDISDEYDDEEVKVIRLSANSYKLYGAIDLENVIKATSMKARDTDSETLGGYILDILGEIPEEDSLPIEVTDDENHFRICTINDRRIGEVILNIERKNNVGEGE